MTEYQARDSALCASPRGVALRGLALYVSAAWEQGDVTRLRALLNHAEQLQRQPIFPQPPVRCASQDDEVAELVAACLQCIAAWLRQPAPASDSGLKAALSILRRLASARPASAASKERFIM